MNRLLQDGERKTVVAGLAVCGGDVWLSGSSWCQQKLQSNTLKVYRVSLPDLKLASWLDPWKLQKREVLKDHSKGWGWFDYRNPCTDSGWGRIMPVLVWLSSMSSIVLQKARFTKGTTWCPHDDANSHSTNFGHHSLWWYGCFHYRPDARRSGNPLWHVGSSMSNHQVLTWLEGEIQKVLKPTSSLPWLKNRKLWIWKCYCLSELTAHFEVRLKWPFAMVRYEDEKGPDYAGFQREKNRYSSIYNCYRGWGSMFLMTVMITHGWSVRSQPAHQLRPWSRGQAVLYCSR